jgi:hypothetical protein
MKLFSLAALAATALVTIVNPAQDLPDPYWESGDCYVYYTSAEATFTGESDGVAYFETADGNVWGAYIYDSDLQESDTYTLTFENRESRAEYVRAEEYGIEDITRTDNARIVAID